MPVRSSGLARERAERRRDMAPPPTSKEVASIGHGFALDHGRTRERRRRSRRVPPVPGATIGELVPVVEFHAVAIGHDHSVGSDLVEPAPERKRGWPA